MVSSIQSKLNSQQSTMNGFQTKQSSIERKVDRGIAFTTQLDLNKSLYTLKKNEKIVFGHVISNHGNAYDRKSGIFTSPKSGIYGFYYNIHTLIDKFALVELTSNGDKIHSLAYAGSHSSAPTDGSTFVVLYLSKGERVWLRAGRDCSIGETMKYQENTFSGFLIHSY
ncbi:cerebellin-2-like [Saccostrea cucullata]|uniref:cerebellin-2-like n=1 Tax=Saccostrea cuccullata TaxID=36930 RepID=UPI002ED3D269